MKNLARVNKRLSIFVFLLGYGLLEVRATDLDGLRSKANEGDVEAMVELAEARYWGRGVDLDWKKSFAWAEKASVREHPVASYRMGVQYLLGQGVKEDIVLGQQLIKLSADGIEKLAENSDHRAQFYIAIMFHYGIGRMDDIPKARQWMELAAEGGQVDAQYYMGLMYHLGVGAELKRDLIKAKHWWRMAADQGHVPAQYHLGMVLLRSKKEKEQPEGMKYLKKAVDHKLDRAELFMGKVAMLGTSMPKDAPVAFKNFENSANQGYMRGQFLAGQALAKGVGVKPDPVAASVWLTLVLKNHELTPEQVARPTTPRAEMIRNALASKRNLDAKLTTAQLVEVRLRSGKFEAAPSLATRKSRAGLMAADSTFLASLSLEELKKHAADGDMIAKARLAEIYFNGKKLGGQVISRKDLRESIRLSIELAIAGHPDSQWNLALFNLKGVYQQLADGTRVELLKKNPAEAANWLRKAASQDYTSAMVILGGLYEKGEGVSLDYKKAMEWFEKAAALGDAQACHVIGLAHLNGRGKVVSIDKVKAVEWFRRGAEKGDPQAQYALAGAYLKGEGMEKSPETARKWFARAAWQNEPRAQLQLGRMLRDGLGGPKDMARAAMWVNLALNNRVFEAFEVFNAIVEKLSRAEKIRARELVDNYFPRQEQREVSGAGDDLTRTVTEANKGNKDAQYRLGLRYLNGTGVKADRVRACKWLKLAALQSHAKALKEYEELSLKMTNEEIRAADEAADGFQAKQ